ncbi:nuclear matrix protein, partial [Moniliophthora roreri]
IDIRQTTTFPPILSTRKTLAKFCAQIDIKATRTEPSVHRFPIAPTPMNICSSCIPDPSLNSGYATIHGRIMIMHNPSVDCSISICRVEEDIHITQGNPQQKDNPPNLFQISLPLPVDLIRSRNPPSSTRLNVIYV